MSRWARDACDEWLTYKIQRQSVYRTVFLSLIILIYASHSYSGVNRNISAYPKPAQINSGLFIAYGSSLGEPVMEDSNGRGYFTRSLIESVMESDQDLVSLMSKVRKEVAENSRGIQNVNFNNHLSRPFFFKASSRGRKRAIVIGNNIYTDPAIQLKNTDAEYVSDALTQLGYQVTTLRNVSFSLMEATLRGFLSESVEGDVNVFHFSGHGAVIGGKSYMIPIDVEREDAQSVRAKSIAVEDLVQIPTEKENVTNLFLFDAARAAIDERGMGESPSLPAEQKTNQEVSYVNEASLRFRLAELLARIYTSNVIVEAPELATSGEKGRLSIRLGSNASAGLSSDLAEFESTLRELRSSSGADLQFTGTLELRINTPDFEFTELTPASQLVNPSEGAVWKWTFEPNEAGAQEMFIDISAIYMLDNQKIYQSLHDEEGLIYVEQDIVKSSFEFVLENWEYFVSSILLPLIMWGWSLRRKRREVSMQ